MSIRKVTIGCPSLEIDYISQETNYGVKDKSIFVNLGTNPAILLDTSIESLTSCIIKDVNIASIEEALVIRGFQKDFDFTQFSQSWQSAFEIFDVPGLRDVPLWRSKIEKVDGYSFYLWYSTSACNSPHCMLKSNNEANI